MVRSAAGLADYTLVTIHAHEGGRDRVLPADFLVTFARTHDRRAAPTCSSATARTCCAASRSTRASRFSTAWAISSFRTRRCCGCPRRTTSPTISVRTSTSTISTTRVTISTRAGFPADRLIWEAVVAVPRFRGRELTELALHPITLGFGQARSVRGRPLFAEGELGQKILGDITKLSSAMGTKITVRDGVGYVDVQRTTTSH